MLSTLAQIANQLELDGHIELADQLDDVITSLAARQPFERYGPEDIWEEEMEGAEPSMEEEMEESSLVMREPGDVGLGASNEDTYSDVLVQFKHVFLKWLLKHPTIKEFATKGYKAINAPEGVLDAIVDEIEHVLSELAALGHHKVKWDDAFPNAARQLAREALAKVSMPAA